MPLIDYESLGVLAVALYGDVHKLRHRATGDLVALKRMDMASASRRRTKDTNDPIEEDVFAEVQTNLKLRKLGGHRYVVAMRDCFVDEQSVSIVTEFCGRGELLEVVNARGSLLPVEDALRYFHQIVQGVAFLHANGIAHRDLSLENVLVDDFDSCKLSDFGMATAATSHRATGIGKVQYMAPEACHVPDEGANYYNPFESDIWSLGVIFLTLLTGQYPFQHALETDANFMLLSNLGVEYVLERCEFDMDGYEDIVDMLRRMLAVDPSMRATAAELLEHECFDEFSAVDVDFMNEEESLTEEEEEEVIEEEELNPADDEHREAAPTATPARSYGVANLFVIRRPPPIDTTTKPSCMYVPSISTRKSPAVLKEQLSSVIALTPKLSLIGDSFGRPRPQRRSLKCRKKCALRGILDGVFRRKKARAASSTGATH